MSSVDVIVPCYRYGHFLRQCVESVLKQSGPSVRVLIIDDASPDNSSEVAAELTWEDSRVTFLKHNTNKGHISTYNEGIDWAKGDYLLLLSADDWLLPGALQRAATVLSAHPEVALTCGKALVADKDHPTPVIPVIERSFRILTGQGFIEKACTTAAYAQICTPTAIVRTSIQKLVGGYNPLLPHTGDLEMWLRFARHGSLAFLDAFQAVYRKHENNMHYSYGRIANLNHHFLAFESALAGDGEHFVRLDKLKRKYRRVIASKAARLAAGALIRGKLGLCRQSARFALEVVWSQTPSVATESAH